MVDITMSLNDTLELDTIIKESDLASESVSFDSNKFNSTGIQTHTEILSPQEAGTYSIEVSGQELTVKVTDPSRISETVLPEDLVAWYRFEDGDGRDYASNSENNNVNWGDSTSYDLDYVNGTVSFKQGPSPSGFASNSVDVTGSKTYMADLDSSGTEISGRDPRTVMCWFIQTEQDKSGIFGIGEPTNTKGYQIYGRDGQYLQPDVWSGSEGINPFNYSNNNWYHTSIVYDGGSHLLYVNGSLYDSNPDTDVNLNFDRIVVGSELDFDDGLDGKVSDARVYNRALDSSEIKDIYNNTKP